MATVVLENVYKHFDRAVSSAPSEIEGKNAQNQKAPVLRNVNLTVEDGEFLVLVGPSGCGKSTLLRIISGLESLTGGQVWIDDRQVNTLPPKARNTAMVFQNYALYPHMTVYENIAFGLRRGNPERSLEHWMKRGGVALTRSLPPGLRYLSPEERQIQAQVQQVARLLEIETLLERLPKQLSGGQKQRVALGRAIARNPQVFLMDEPLSNLDAQLRMQTRSQIVQLQRQVGVTTIYVTHDQVEAMTMGDRIAVMNQGELQQVAPPLDLYHRPANQFVAQFIGSPPMNFIPVELSAPLLLRHSQFRLTLPEAWKYPLQKLGETALILGIRPEHLQESAPAPKNLPIQVQAVEQLGHETLISGTLPEDSTRLNLRLDQPRSLEVGETLWFSMIPEQIHVFSAQTGLAIFPIDNQNHKKF
ncbi:ABC transporter ATP-binding protein [Roseofilum capinflatum]|uniref:ATP-binding cassette domain-containing protein n=1 Tax=Roseofilum capinflatum BLCC-M114 TaxID=3022440 RepID=A0ABT7BD74_9CYAN|nr:ATP-binding cassette domain-containing protein [Roseofilum capinflatum]MDJ1177138.1 ATP-binding cassette domain-containing protein [Roseofilum capinflatum BLCC-M114]